MTQQTIVLKAGLREKNGDKLEKLAAKDFIPAVVYGAGKDNKHLKIKVQDFVKAYEKAGESNLIDLQIEGEKGEGVKIIIKEVQKDVVKDSPIHADFFEVDMTKEIVAEIPLHFIGESKAVKELGGVLVKNVDFLEVKCLPGDLVDHLDIDISSLNTFEDSIKVNEVKLPGGMKLAHESNDNLVNVQEMKVEEEPVIAPAEGVPAEGEATPAEGAPATEGEAEKKAE